MEPVANQAIPSESSESTAADSFMLKEYESIAAAHFDSQTGLRQQFRFYLIIAAVPLTVLGFAFNHEGNAALTTNFDIGHLPGFASEVFLGIGVLGFLLSLAMIHTAFDCTLYARTVNGIRHYFRDRAHLYRVDLAPYFVMPLEKTTPKYFHFRSFFYQHLLISLVNSVYLSLACYNLSHRPCLSVTFAIVMYAVNFALYPLFAALRERAPIAR